MTASVDSLKELIVLCTHTLLSTCRKRYIPPIHAKWLLSYIKDSNPFPKILFCINNRNTTAIIYGICIANDVSSNEVLYFSNSKILVVRFIFFQRLKILRMA